MKTALYSKKIIIFSAKEINTFFLRMKNIRLGIIIEKYIKVDFIPKYFLSLN